MLLLLSSYYIIPESEALGFGVELETHTRVTLEREI
jgi:hypothetical protein